MHLAFARSVHVGGAPFKERLTLEELLRHRLSDLGLLIVCLSLQRRRTAKIPPAASQGQAQVVVLAVSAGAAGTILEFVQYPI